MKKVLLTLLTVIVVLGVVAAAGLTGYRFGYVQGVQTTARGDAPALRPFDDINPRGMPMHPFGFDREFRRGFGMRGFPGMGFGFFSIFRLLVPLAFLGLIVWFVYLLFSRSGWQLTRTVPTVAPEGSPEPIDTEAKG